MTDSSELRASDEQRDVAAREIRDHFAAGRLTDEELSDRLSAIYKARTEGELHALRTDLPMLPANERAELVKRRRHLQRRAFQEAGGALVPFIICVVIWAASGASGQFWPIWVGLVAAIPLMRTTWSLYGPSPELDRVERELEERQQRRRSHERRGRRSERHRP